MAKSEMKWDWTRFANLASTAVTPDAGLILPSPISLWNLWKKKHNQILPIPTFFNPYRQILRLQVKPIWFLSSIRISSAATTDVVESNTSQLKTWAM